MAKRRAEGPLLHSAVNKRHCLSLRVAGSPPSLLVLQDHHDKKRPLNSEDQDQLMETTVECVTAFSDCRSLEKDPLLLTCTNKRLRHDASDTNVHNKCDKADEINAEDNTFNSFQYWRVPLPELDLSLLEDEDQCQTKETVKVKDSSFDTMET